jgi:predicted AAA+ superfamily ATPase
MIAGQRPSVYFDLENPVDVRRLSAPMRALEKLSGLVIIDEVQRQPELFELLRVLVDRPENPARFLLLGSASPYLVKGVSESLAGRIGFTDLSGFDLAEIGAGQYERLWLRGGFPRAYLAADAPARRRSMLIALEDLHLEHLWVVYPGDQAYDLDDRISVIPATDLIRLKTLMH